MLPYHDSHAGVAQLVERLLPKQAVAGSSPVSRSVTTTTKACLIA